ncbi:MAG: alpha/beta hydrolase [Alphaproteobacteria bacterium]|nr:alpha/beta hydrolase [Alphaproteobacteria bacterium]
MILALALMACAPAEPEPPPEPEHCAVSETHAVPTDDGATVVLHRHATGGPPVLVVHGISSNHHSWDLSPDRSLAVYLAEAGFDPWLLDLRGHGDALEDAEGRRQWGGWSLDDYGRHDLPAAVDYVLAQTGAERLGYVGHSLGGMVGAIYAGTVPGAVDRLSALVAVGSPMDFTDPDPLMSGALTLARVPLPVVPTDRGAQLQAGMGERGGTSIEKLIDLMLLNDIDPAVRPKMYRQVASPMTAGELKQLAQVLPQASFSDRLGETDYTRALQGVPVPTLVIAGRADQIAPVDRVLAYHESSGAQEKRMIIAGRATGFAADYGHLDLTMGDHARAEIYPLIAEWLRR